MIKNIIILSIFFLLVLPVYAKNKKLTVYPNPWIPESGKSLDSSSGDQMRHGAYTADGWVKFRGVNSKNDDNCSGVLKIYDIAGRLIREKHWTIQEEKLIPLPQTHKEDRDHTVHWDGKDNDYNYVESGVYIWIIKENDGSKYDGKIVVVR
jgi:hypothetical protein